MEGQNMPRRIALVSLLIALGFLAHIPRVEAQQPAGAERFGHWEKAIAAFEEQDRKQAPPKNAYLFVGSSSIRLWNLPRSFPELDVVNRGFGGSQIADTVHFAPRIILPHQPRMVLLYAGDNDIGAGRTPEQVLADFKALVQVVHGTLPKTRVAFLSIKPSLARWNLWDQVQKANALVKAFCQEDARRLYIDVGAGMLGADGKPRPELFVKDGLHLSPEGYALWATAVKAELQKVGEKSASKAAVDWPPPLKGAKDGTVTLHSELFLHVPESVAAAKKDGAAPLVVAKTPPSVDFAYHRDPGPDAVSRRLWSSWGDICVATDGRVYCAIGDHGDDVKGDARCFLYRWDPGRRVLERIVDMNEVVPPQPGQPAWSKVHAKIDEAPDGTILFSSTLNDGNRATKPDYRWNEKLPGGQLYQYDPKTGKICVFSNLPPRRCTATSLLDRERQIWWCNLEAGEGNALWGLDLRAKKPAFQAADGSMGFNRSFALARDGSIIFNGKEAIWRYDPAKKEIAPTRSVFPNSPGMRSATRESKDGWIYGRTHVSGQLFRYSPAKELLELLGPAWLTGSYVTVTELSPDERFLYYLPGAYGGAFRDGTPVVQYEIATGRRKVLAFLAEAFEREYDYVPAGTYGMKVSTDGGTLYVNSNGHAGDRVRPTTMRSNGFGLCGFAAVHVPASER
jgi:lysophospholipase L1-like esterase